MPDAFVIIRGPAGNDAFGVGQLTEDSGVITDMDGGFDTASCTILVRGEASISLGGEHPSYKGMYLFGVSPKTIIGGDSLVTLTYKGFHNRKLLTGDPPSVGSGEGKFTWGCQMAQHSWAKGDLSGTVDGVDLATRPVNVLQPHETVKITWLGSAKVNANVFKISNGKSSYSFGPIDEDFYSTMAFPSYNFPHGWVPTDSNSEQAYAGLPVYLNSVTFTAIPKFSPG
jgi:hypothetical protein